MRLTLRLWEHFRGLILVFALLFVPFLALFYYARMQVEVSLLRRSIRAATAVRDDYVRRNAALRRAVSGMSGDAEAGLDSSTRLQMIAKNRIVRVRLPESLGTPGE